MDDAGSLLGDRLHEFWMIMTKRSHRNAGERVEITLTRQIKQPRAFAVTKGHWKPPVGVHQMRHGRT